MNTVQGALNLSASDVAAEFLPVTNNASPLQIDSVAHAAGLDAAELVHGGNLEEHSLNDVMTILRGTPNVATAEPVWLQSSEHKYLSCDYKLNDNPNAQALAVTARSALLAHGVSAEVLDDSGTMEFVSVRHFAGRPLLQVAFVHRPIGSPSQAYVAFLDPGNRHVISVARANWYLWG